jgi:hypothetical protein
MSGLAIFSLKYPSLLQFDQGRTEDKALKYNLRTLYGVQQIPCETQIRERLDPLEPEKIRKPSKTIFAQLQRGKVLEQYQYLNKAYLLSVDGAGDFSSHEIHFIGQEMADKTQLDLGEILNEFTPSTPITLEIVDLPNSTKKVIVLKTQKKSLS